MSDTTLLGRPIYLSFQADLYGFALIGAGARVSKFFGLKLEEVDLNQNLMKVFGKGAKEHQIPIGSKVAASNVEESTE